MDRIIVYNYTCFLYYSFIRWAKPTVFLMWVKFLEDLPTLQLVSDRPISVIILVKLRRFHHYDW
jgi:hypothetical protein